MVAATRLKGGNEQQLSFRPADCAETPEKPDRTLGVSVCQRAAWSSGTRRALGGRPLCSVDATPHSSWELLADTSADEPVGPRDEWHDPSRRVQGSATDSRQITPKHQGKPTIIRDQRTRPVNKIDNLTKSAKPPSPVQIRAAPPFSGSNSTITPFLPRAVRRQLFSNLLEIGGRGNTAIAYVAEPIALARVAERVAGNPENLHSDGNKRTPSFGAIACAG